jgi:hypothetical protein
MFALGLLSWLYTRPTIDAPSGSSKTKFAKKPDLLAANVAALRAGFNYGETTEDFAHTYQVSAASMPAGTYRNITGNVALSYGLVAAAHRAGLRLVLGSYPITPASDILHVLSGLKRFGVTTMQAEDEIAGIGIAIGASFGGALGVTTTSGPGLALKSEAIGLAVSLELPLVIVDVQRGGPRPACRPRPSRPTCCRRCSAATASRRCRSSRRSPRPTASTRRSRRAGSRRHTAPRSSCCPTATSPTGPSRGGPGDQRPARPHGRVRDRAQRGRRRRQPGLPALPARPRDARPAVGGPRHAWPGAPHRRHREGRHHRQHLLRPGQPRADDPAAAGQDRRIADTMPELEVDDPDGDARGAGHRLGLDLRPDPGRPVARAKDRPPGRHDPPAPPQPVPAQPRRGAASLRAGHHARDEPRPAARCCCARHTSSTSSPTRRCAGCPSRPRELAEVIRDDRRRMEATK